MTLSVDTTLHLGEMFVIIGVAWRANRTINRLIDVMQDFPPHRHTNGTISYPKGFEPPVVERIAREARVSG